MLLAGTLVLAGEHPDITGRWRLNEQLSQDVQAKIVLSTGGDEVKSDIELRRFREALEDFVRGAQQIEVEQKADQVQFSYADDDVRIFYPGRQHVRQRAGGVKVKAAPRWEGESFVVEQMLEGGVFEGAKDIETYTLEEGGSRLGMMVHLDDKHLKEPLNARLVYDRVPATHP
jgi:hypothetical protein